MRKYMTTGTVKFFDKDKGFGFITPTDGSKDVFVHKNNINGTIRDGDSVSYDVQEGRNGKGPEAANVSKT